MMDEEGIGLGFFFVFFLQDGKESGEARGEEEHVVTESPEAAPSQVSPAGAPTPGLRALNGQELSRTHTDAHIRECVKRKKSMLKVYGWRKSGAEEELWE